MSLADYYPELKGWTPVEKDPTVAKTPGIPAESLQVSPFLRAALPMPMQYQPDTLKQYNRPGISSFRFSPVSPAASPANNSAIQNISQIIAQQVVNNTPTSSGGSTGPDNDIILGLNRQSFGSFDSVATQGTASNVASLTITGNASGSNHLALAMSFFDFNSLDSPGSNPDGTWTGIDSNFVFWKVISAAGPLTITQSPQATSGAVLAATQVLAFFKTNGSTPVFTLRGSGSGGTVLAPPAFTPAAGNSLLFLDLTGVHTLTFQGTTISDNVGNTWVSLADVFVPHDLGGGFFHSSGCTLLYAQNVKNQSTSITVNVPNGAGGAWAVYEVSNMGNISSGAYTFQSSDLNKLVQFSGGANVVATLPVPTLGNKWQALVSNSSPGTTTLAPAAGTTLNGGSSITLPSGGSTWVFCDGTNYWATESTLPLTAFKIVNQWLDSYNPITGAFTQSQPAFSNLSGNIATSQVNNGTGANGQTFWRGDNVWSGIGGVNSQTTNYTAIASDANKLISFNSSSGVTLTLPGSAPSATWQTSVENIGAGVLTVNPNGRNLDGVASNILLTQNQGVVIYADGSNYFTERGLGSGVGGTLLKIANYAAATADAGKLIAYNPTTQTAPSFIQKNDTSTGVTGTTLALPYLSNVTVGNLLIAAFSWSAAAGGNTVTPVSVTDTMGNTWTQVSTTLVTPQVNGAALGCAVYQTIAKNSGANTVTMTISATQQFRRLGLLEYTNQTGGTLVDVSNTNTGSGTAVTSGNITTTSNNDLILELAFANTGATMAAGTGYTARYGASASNGEYAQDKTLGTAGTTSFSGTLSATSDWASFILGIFPNTAPTLFLPNPPPINSWMIFVQNYAASNSLVVSRNAQTIDGAASDITLLAGKGIALFTDGTNYFTFRGGS